MADNPVSGAYHGPMTANRSKDIFDVRASLQGLIDMVVFWMGAGMRGVKKPLAYKKLTRLWNMSSSRLVTWRPLVWCLKDLEEKVWDAAEDLFVFKKEAGKQGVAPAPGPLADKTARCEEALVRGNRF